MLLFWELILRFSFGGTQRRFTRFVSIASLVGMTLGVAALITVLSVMNGFAGELHQRLLSVTPDITLESKLVSDQALQDLVGLSLTNPTVRGATPYIKGTALLRNGRQSRGVG